MINGTSRPRIVAERSRIYISDVPKAVKMALREAETSGLK